jgi:hypothetical protein
MLTPTFDAGTLACALTLAGNTPTPAELTAALAEMYPAGGAPTVADLLAAEWLVPAVSDRRRLRLPPPSLAELDRRLTERPAPAPTPPIPDPGPRFSLFRGGIKSVKPTSEITLAQLHDELTGPRWKELTARLRAVGRGAREYETIKSSLDNVTPAGTFAPTRARRNLAAASGLIVLDFDKLPDVAAARAALLADPAVGPVVAMLFVSPSGDGLKCILPLDDRFLHLDNFTRLSRYLSRKYAPLGLVADDSGKDVSRACFLCHDPHAYLSPDYQHPHKLAA